MSEKELAGLSEDDPIDLLERAWITVDGPSGRVEVSLAELLARLGREEPTELTYALPHQQHVLHAFVVQLMALVAARSGNPRLDRSAVEWRDALRQLAGGREGFCLMVSDLSKPAFMQPPVPEGNLEAFSVLSTPDELDMLVLAKNHDVKAARIRSPRIEHWVFALISLQTQEGYLGRGNYGVARMNGGFGNRPGLGVTPTLAWAARVCRDVRVALRACPLLLSEAFPYTEDGIAFVWLPAWDGATSLSFDQLDPFFVEICRRTRFTIAEGSLAAHVAASKTARIETGEVKGNTGDLWTPIKREANEALTLGSSGFSYDRLAKLLFEDEWLRPPALEVAKTDGDAPWVIARALVRGQGKTEGFHERAVPVPRAARGLFGTSEGMARLGSLSKQRIEAAKALRLKILKPALCAFLQGGPAEKLRLDDDRPDALLDAVERRIDSEFFGRLFEDADAPPDEAEARFQKWLVELGRSALESGFRGLPTSTARRERAEAEAESRFMGGIRKQFPRAFGEVGSNNKTEEAQQ